MASGCILGDCPLCTDLIYEDEMAWDDELGICHESCLNNVLWRSVHGSIVLVAVRRKSKQEATP